MRFIEALDAIFVILNSCMFALSLVTHIFQERPNGKFFQSRFSKSQRSP